LPCGKRSFELFGMNEIEAPSYRPLIKLLKTKSRDDPWPLIPLKGVRVRIILRSSAAVITRPF
jgi:hypothetical protein